MTELENERFFSMIKIKNLEIIRCNRHERTGSERLLIFNILINLINEKFK